MSRQTWVQQLVEAQGDGSALANSTSQTSILPAAAKFTLPSNLFLVGTRLRIRASGRISNIVTTPGTLTFEVKFGSTVVMSSGALVLNTTAKTNVSWLINWMATCRAIGALANLMHVGVFMSESVVSSPSGTMGSHAMPASAPAVGTNFDSGASQTVDLFATWSIANAGNSIQLHEYGLELMN